MSFVGTYRALATQTRPVPSLDLQFAAGQFSSLITFSRGTNATMFNSTGTLVYAPSNVLLYSERFDNAAWGKNNATVNADALIAPDGNVTADKLIDDATNSQHFVSVSVSGGLAVSTTYTFSCFAKVGERIWVQLRTTDKANTVVRSWFNLSTGTVGTVQAGHTASIQSVGNGWYRCAVIFSSNTGATNGAVGIQVNTADNQTAYTGDGTSGIYIWGAQLSRTPMLNGVTADLTTYYPTTSAAYYGPRLDYNPSTLAPRGLLIEEQRTNSIRNNTMVGAVAGTPGTPPTNWTVATPNAGLTREIVETGTENGITYVDIRYSGTSSATSLVISLESNTQIAASNGQSWTISFWAKVVSGAANDYTLRISLRDGAGASLGQIDTAFVPTSTLTRFLGSGTLANASVAYLQPQIRLALTNGAAYDFTLRIGLPQLEQGAFATSVIPTTTAAATRNADVASVNTLTPWFNAASGTIVGEFDAVASGTRTISAFDDNTANESIRLRTVSTDPKFTVTYGGADQADIDAGTVSTNTVYKFAGAYAVNDFAACINGNAVQTDTSGTVPIVDRLRVGTSQAGNYLDGWLRRVSYYPTRLPNATLQSLTA